MTAPPLPDRAWALFLDFDGTLVELAPAPDSVVVAPETVALLTRLAKGLDAALAVISGRPIAQIDRFLAPLILPAAGLHGLERRPAGGDLRTTPPDPAIAALRGPLAEAVAPWPGVTLEDKGATLAVHFRQAPDRAEDCARLVARLVEALGTEADRLQVMAGHMVYEIKPAGIDKGQAIAEFMTEAPFRDRLPVYAGDDRTDEDGFRVVNAMAGHSLRIGPPPQAGAGRESETAARWRLASPAALGDWLRAVADRVSAADKEGTPRHG